MTQEQAHRNLLNACKMLLHRLEEKQGKRLWQADWRAIVVAWRAIEDSKYVLSRLMGEPK